MRPFVPFPDWHLLYTDVDGVSNGRSYDDSSWIRMDTTAPHSGRRAGRIFLPSGMPTGISIPCQRGDERGAKAKKDTVCKAGFINVLNGTTYAVSVWCGDVGLIWSDTEVKTSDLRLPILQHA